MPAHCFNCNVHQANAPHITTTNSPFRSLRRYRTTAVQIGVVLQLPKEFLWKINIFIKW